MGFLDRLFKKKSPHELMLAGDYKGALKGYKDLLKQKRRSDPQVILKIGDLYMKLGQPEKAKPYYVKVGDYFGRKGFFNKSVAAFKKALNISPDDEEILDKLSAYNDKVPKYMINEAFLQKANKVPIDDLGDETGEFWSAEDSPQFSFSEEPNDALAMDGTVPESDHEIPLAQDASPGPSSEELVKSLPISLDPDIEPEQASAPSSESLEQATPTEAPLANTQEESFELVNASLDEGVEPAFDFEPPVAEPVSANPDPVQAGQSEAMIEEEDDDSSSGADWIPDFDPNEELDFDEAEESASVEPVIPSDVASSPPNQQPRVVSTSTESESMVFTSRHTTEQAQIKPESGMEFSSFDDALDSLFEVTGSPELDRPTTRREENQRHWALFRTMPKEVFTDFVMALGTQDYEPGEYIVRQDEPGEEMFLLANGEIEVEVTFKERVTIVARLKEGDFFGEASVLTGKPRNASIKALTPVSCLRLDRSHLKDLSKSHPSIMASIRSIYYTRIMQNASRLGEAGKVAQTNG